MSRHWQLFSKPAAQTFSAYAGVEYCGGPAFHGLLVPSACVLYAEKISKQAGFPSVMAARIGRTRPCYAAKLRPTLRWA